MELDVDKGRGLLMISPTMGSPPANIHQHHHSDPPSLSSFSINVESNLYFTTFNWILWQTFFLCFECSSQFISAQWKGNAFLRSLAPSTKFNFTFWTMLIAIFNITLLHLIALYNVGFCCWMQLQFAEFFLKKQYRWFNKLEWYFLLLQCGRCKNSAALHFVTAAKHFFAQSQLCKKITSCQL